MSSLISRRNFTAGLVASSTVFALGPARALGVAGLAGEFVAGTVMEFAKQRALAGLDAIASNYVTTTKQMESAGQPPISAQGWQAAPGARIVPSTLATIASADDWLGIVSEVTGGCSYVCVVPSLEVGTLVGCAYSLPKFAERQGFQLAAEDKAGLCLPVLVEARRGKCAVYSRFITPNCNVITIQPVDAHSADVRIDVTQTGRKLWHRRMPCNPAGMNMAEIADGWRIS